ncbi:MAG: hypothetical protein WC263_02000 [Candidatus Micrarchaeia archaeon]|jgi:hypothetical protein
MMKNPFYAKHAKDIAIKAGVGLLIAATFAAAVSCTSTRSACPGTQKESNRYQMRR